MKEKLSTSIFLNFSFFWELFKEIVCSGFAKGISIYFVICGFFFAFLAMINGKSFAQIVQTFLVVGIGPIIFLLAAVVTFGLALTLIDVFCDFCKIILGA